MKKLIILLIFMLIFVFSIRGNSTENKISVEEYEELLNDYESLLTDYENLLNLFSNLNDKYEQLINDYEKLNIIYLNEIKIHEMSERSLSLSLKTIEDLEFLLARSNNKNITLIGKIGFVGNKNTYGIGLNIEIPFIPLTTFFNVDYLYFYDPPLNLQFGIGYKF